MINDDRINAYFDSLKPFDFKAYEITLHLKTPAALYDSLHLDGLLTKAVVENALHGEPLADSAEPYWLPLPLKQAWTADSGLPLWHTTDFRPIETDTVDSAFWHKRTIDPAFLATMRGGKPMNIRPTQGALKEYRIPLALHSALKWRATFEGDGKVVADLLQRISSIGKKRSQGYGLIESWELQPIDTFSFFNTNDLPLRPLPTPFLPDYPIRDIAFTSWTPPYWSPAAMMLCHTPQLF